MSATTEHPHGHQHKPLEEIEAPLTINQEVAFHFKATVDPDTKEKNEKRATIKLQLPLVTFEGLIAALSKQDAKITEFVLDCLNDQIIQAARTQINDDTKPVNSQEELDLSKLALEAIAYMPKAERRGGGIAKEIWEAFGKDYIEVIMASAGKKLEQAQNASVLLMKKLQTVKTNKKVLKYLDGMLDVYAANSQNLEEFQECVEFLKGKAKVFLETDEEALLQNL